MCMPKPPPAPPPPLPAQAPPQLAILAPADAQRRNSTSALAANKGRNSLRIDKTQSAAGAAGSGLNIPT